MKKTYISPSMLVVRLSMTKPLASSPAITFGSTSVDAASVEVNEYNPISDKNLWDEEW